jgi:hypothetical protein
MPAFLLRVPQARRRAAAHRAEFISVSGQCPDRSAPRSELRLKRISGAAAATVPPRAPMNSPEPMVVEPMTALRVSFPTLNR